MLVGNNSLQFVFAFALITTSLIKPVDFMYGNPF
uniref:Uncharacterized protein n=1 Tax=virus sp. ctLl75 TaxID=2828249 RepID=A0A8S5RB35_9VIRU|nr:MAG TPA: hypothetical protein [virus sp. ctLl75]